MKKIPHHIGWRNDQGGPQLPSSDYYPKSLEQEDKEINQDCIGEESKSVLKEFFKRLFRFFTK